MRYTEEELRALIAFIDANPIAPLPHALYTARAKFRIELAAIAFAKGQSNE